MYTRDDGYQSNSAIFLNATGQVAGVAQRFNGGSVDLGQSAWVYDPASNLTFAAPEFSLRADGYAFSQVTYLGDGGLALGYYKLYDGTNFVGDRAIRFTIADGWQDLGLLVHGGLTTNGWQYLANAFTASADGTIVGTGLLASQSGGASSYLIYMDNTPPALNCPTDLVVTNPPGQCEAVVTFTVTATDNRDPAPVVTCIPPSGSSFPVGRTTVLCTAVDTSGNTNTCSFTVSVYPTATDSRRRNLDATGDQPQLVGGRLVRRWHQAGRRRAQRPALHLDRLRGDLDQRDISGDWHTIASSADGTRLIAADHSGLLYTSTDSGATWAAHSGITGDWEGVASSADGSRLMAVNFYDNVILDLD